MLSLCLWSCEEESHNRTGWQEGTMPIGFTPDVTTQTRGEDLTPLNLANFGVLAYFTQGGSFNSSVSTPNFMYNQKIEKSGGAWTYSPTKFWPTNSNDKVSFFAYAPHNVPGITLPVASSAGYPSFDYQVQNTEAAQTDLLLAEPKLDKAAADGTIKFSFKHALTRVVLNVEAGNDFNSVTINSLSIKTKKSGTVAFDHPSAASGWIQWSNIASGTGNDITCTATLSSKNITAGATQKMATFFLLPVAAAGGTLEDATLTFSYTTIGTMPETKTVTDLPLTSMDNWKAATSISYKLKIARTAVTVEVGDIQIWEGANVDVDKGGEIIEGYRAEDIKTGDYFYDDGTCSDGGYRMLTNGTTMQYNMLPIAGKTCIGIVYANGKTGTERGDNISSYSGTGLNGATEIKGYVVALNRIDNVRRSGNGSNNTTAFNGYTNTKGLSTSASNPREIGEVLINSTTAPPGLTSGWYVMSLGQTMYAYDNRVIINKSRQNISSGNYGGMDFSNLWTSSYGTNGGFPTLFNNGNAGGSYGTTMNNVSPCFTF